MKSSINQVLFHDELDKRKIEELEIGICQPEVMFLGGAFHKRDGYSLREAGAFGNTAEAFPSGIVAHDVVQCLFTDIWRELRDILRIEEVPVNHRYPLVAPYMKNIFRDVVCVMEIKLQIDYLGEIHEQFGRARTLDRATPAAVVVELKVQRGDLLRIEPDAWRPLSVFLLKSVSEKEVVGAKELGTADVQHLIVLSATYFDYQLSASDDLALIRL